MTSHFRIQVFAAVTAMVALVAVPGTASAATRYTAPAAVDVTGSCTAVAPCRIDHAVSGAAAGDDVVIAPGTYAINFPVAANAAINVRGQAGQPRPRLVGGDNSATIDMSYGGTLTYVEVTTGTHLQNAISVEGVVLDRVRAEASGTANAAIELRPNPGGVVLRNSIARTTGSGAADAVQIKDNGKSGTVTIVGTTAVSSGNRGVVAKAGTSTNVIKNSIARGVIDIEVKNTANAYASYTSYRPANAVGVTAGPGNVGAPLFADEANGIFEQADGSPTLNSGAPDAQAGTVDFAGNPRTSGTSIDIGAFERQVADSGSGGGAPDPQAGSGSADGGSGGSGTSDPGTADPGTSTAPLPPATEPVLGTSVNVGDVSGTPLVRLPGSSTFVPVTDATTIPVGAIVDATKGRVELTSVRDASGATQTGEFWGGVFQVRQSRKDTVTELALTGGDFSRCGRATRRGKVVASRTSRHGSRVRRLWGRDRGGRFRTRGRNGSATVRGTRWLTEDRCDGTLFKVTEGAIDVHDDRKRKTVRLKRGQSYLAGNAAARKRR